MRKGLIVLLFLFLSGVSILYAQVYIEKVKVYWSENGGSESAYVYSGETYDLDRDAGSQVNIRIYRTTGSPTPLDFMVADWGNTNTQVVNSSATSVFFENCVGPMNSQVWCSVNTNQGMITINVNNLSSSYPDLIVSNITVDNHASSIYDYEVGQVVDLDCIVWNIGDEDAGSSYVGYYIGTNSTDTSDRFDRDYCGSISAGGGSSESEPYTFTSDDVGTRYFVFKADYLDDVDEDDNEDNNLNHFGPFTVNPPPPPEITMTSPASNITVSQETEVNIAWTGSGQTGSTVSICYDEDNIWDNGNHHWIALDQPVTDTYPWDTSSVLPGTYYIGGMIYDGSNIDHDYASGTVTINLYSLNDLFGPTIGSNEIPLFGSTYYLLKFEETNNSQNYFWLPFENGVTVANPEPNLLVTNGELASLLFVLQEMDLSIFDISNLPNTKSELTTINNDTSPPNWWINSVPPFSKRKVDRIKLGNGCFSAANSLTKSYVKGAGKITPDAYIGATLDFIDEFNAVGVFTDDENFEILSDIKAILNLPILLGSETDILDDFFTQWPEQLIQSAIFVNNQYETINDFVEISQHLEAAQAMLDGPVSQFDQDAFFTEYDAALNELSGVAVGFAYDLSINAVSGGLGLTEIKQCAKMLAWQLDMHNDASYIITSNLIPTIDEILELQQNGSFTEENATKLLSLYQSLITKYAYGFTAIKTEMLRIYSKYLKRISVSDNTPWNAASNWVGATQNNLEDVYTFFEYSNIDFEDLAQFNSQYLTKASFSKIVYDWALDYYNSLYNEDRLLVSIENSSLVTNQSNQLEITLKNTYPLSISVSNVSIDLSSLDLTNRDSSMRFTIPSDGEYVYNETITLPSDWLTNHIDELDENNRFPIGINVAWNFSGEEYQHTFYDNVEVTSEHQIIRIEPDKKVYRPGELNILEFEYSNTLPENGITIADFLLKPDGSAQTLGLALTANNRIFTIEEILPDGPYGAWNTKSYLIQNSEIISPILHSNGVFYLVPNIQGDLTSFDWHNFKVLYPQADEEAAFEIRDIFNLSQDYFIEIDSYSTSGLLNIANVQDVILLGGEMANPLSAQITNFNLTQEGDAEIEIVNNAFNSHNAIVIAGWNLRDTQIATIGFIDSWNSQIKNELPEIVISDPENNYISNTEVCEIEGAASVLWDDITEIQLNKNNSGWFNIWSGNEYQIDWNYSVPLDLGVNNIKVKAIDAFGNVSDIDEINIEYVPGSLDAPQNVVIEVVGSVVTLSWDAVSGANSYKVYSSLNPNIPLANWILEEELITETNWNESITDNKKFYYVISSTESIRSKNSGSQDVYHQRIKRNSIMLKQ